MRINLLTGPRKEYLCWNWTTPIFKDLKKKREKKKERLDIVKNKVLLFFLMEIRYQSWR